MKRKQLLLLLALLMTAATGAWAQTAMTKGLFSVSETKRVYFSKGNLQYDGTNWKFAASQWEVLGANGTGANGTATDYPMDLFTWGNIDSPTYNGTTYYTENADLSGITDWGSRMGSGWRTLSSAEWLYLFGMEENNTDKSGHARYRKYFRATVNGVTGIVVLPDDLSGISDIPAESSRGTASNFNGKTYTTDAWSAMESAGCVFLPIAGLRSGATVFSTRGCYWSSTTYNANHGYYVNFDTSGVSPQNFSNRGYGLSVRLVIDQYYLTLADGTEDAGKWTATVGTSTNAKTLPVGRLNEGDAVTLTYGGRLKVKSVKAEKKAPAPAIEYNEASWDGTKVVLTKKTAASEPTAVADAQDGATWDKGWYTVSGNVTITGNVALTADTHLILQDGAQLTINGKLTCISDNSYNLYIYGQEAGDGKLNVSNSSYAFVGPNSSGKTIEIHGGEITATSTSATGFHSDGIKIYGGKLTATSEAWAGIGFNSGNFDVYGGEVEAKSNGTYGILGNVGTPILTVYGGKVQATGGAGSDLKAIHAKIKSGTSGIKFYFTNTEGVWGDGVTYSTETDAPTKRYAKAE